MAHPLRTWLLATLAAHVFGEYVNEAADPLFLQVALETRGRAAHDLVLMHIPYNFGHTIEEVAFAGSGSLDTFSYALGVVEGPLSLLSKQERLADAMQPNGELWGRLRPNLHVKSEVTGCPIYFTPPKYWPPALAEAYFGNKTVFGMLRDPYERLVAQFRGNYADYGGNFPEFYETCDVDGAVKSMMQTYLSGDKYAEGCTYVPQAEYFDPPYGITLAVDNLHFPDSANKVFLDHGYSNLRIATQDILHVDGCNEVWAGDLSCETKALVRKVYARDFELICKYFGRCDENANTCLELVPTMCPSNLTAKKATATYCA